MPRVTTKVMDLFAAMLAVKEVSKSNYSGPNNQHLIARDALATPTRIVISRTSQLADHKSSGKPVSGTSVAHLPIAISKTPALASKGRSLV